MPAKQAQRPHTQSRAKGIVHNSSGQPHPGPRKKADHFKLRLAGFIIITLGLAGLTIWLINPSFQQSGASVAPDRTIQVTMAGFTPANLAIEAGKAVSVELINPDSAGHTDGGGVHQFAAPALGVDVKVQPRSKLTFTIPAAAPGVYNFYCDVCCGGKENPSMQGTISVG